MLDEDIALTWHRARRGAGRPVCPTVWPYPPAFRITPLAGFDFIVYKLERMKLSSVFLGIWFVSVLISPIYVLPSGLPQPADALAALLMPGVFLLYGLWWPRPVRKPLALLALFVYWVLFVNTGWAFYTLEKDLLLSSAYYVFNFLVVLLCMTLYSRLGDRFLRTTMAATILSVFMVVALSFVLKGGAERQTVTFNNPNQLGYFALLSASIVYLGARLLPTNRTIVAAALACCAYLAAISLSKAAMIALALFFVLISIRYPKYAVIISVIALALYAVDFHESPLAAKVTHRLSTIGADHDDNIAGRAYDRILKYPQYIVLGAGEGAYDRFEGSIEIHSSLGTVVFSYGLVGTILFFGALASIAIRMGMSNALALLPPLAYGLTHHGLRFTHFWILLFFCLSVPLSAHRRVGLADQENKPTVGSRVSTVP